MRVRSEDVAEDAGAVPVVLLVVGVASLKDEVAASMVGIADGEWDRSAPLAVWARGVGGRV